MTSETLIPLTRLMREKFGVTPQGTTLRHWYTGANRHGVQLRIEHVGRRVMCCEAWWDEFRSAVIERTGQEPTIRKPRKTQTGLMAREAADPVAVSEEVQRLRAEVERLRGQRTALIQVMDTLRKMMTDE